MSELPAPDFQQLIAAIQRAHHGLQAAAVQAVNTALTLRNWVVGHQIHHDEHGDANEHRQRPFALGKLRAHSLPKNLNFQRPSFRFTGDGVSILKSPSPGTARSFSP